MLYNMGSQTTDKHIKPGTWRTRSSITVINNEKKKIPQRDAIRKILPSIGLFVFGEGRVFPGNL